MYQFVDVSVHSVPKTATSISEDVAVVTPSAIVVCDGATSKPVDGFAIAPIPAARVARIVTETASSSMLNGSELVAELNAAVARAVTASFVGSDVPPYQPASCTLACARLFGETVVVTLVGDTSVRVNGPGGDVYGDRVAIDELTTAARAHYIRLTGDIDGSRDFIMPLLSRQFQYRNSDTHPLGYGVIDGGRTPDKFIRTVTLPVSSVRSIEVFTDGYAKMPDAVTVDAWERAYAEMVDEDPDRCGAYPATKTRDDRTVVIASVSSD